MKTPIHTRLICCWLAFVVLLSSTGYGMVEHWCQMRGYSKTLLMAKATCAKTCQADDSSLPLSAGPVIKRVPCCKTTLSYEHVDVSRFVADHHTASAPQPAAFMPNPALQLLWTALQPVAATGSLPPLVDDPFYRTGRSRLISLCSWLI